MCKIKTYIFLSIVCFACMQCSSNKKKATTETTRYFINAGLKFRHLVEITLCSNGTISGKIYEDQYSDTVKIFPFKGTKKGEKLYITFSGEKPKVGSASKWLDKPWTIRQKGQKEFLSIPFYAKSYKTQKWENVDYLFEAYSAENANVELKKIRI